MILGAVLLAAVACTPLPICKDNGDVSPCATPTPTLKWDLVADPDLAGHDLYEREPGGPSQLIATIPCRWNDFDGDGVGDAEWCSGVNLDLSLQKACPGCLPNTLHEFAVLAYDTAGNRSVTFSNWVSVCFSPVCAAPGPCS